MKTKIEIDDNLLEIIEQTLCLFGVRFTKPTILRYMYKHLHNRGDLIQGLCNVLRECGITSTLMMVDREDIESIPRPAIVVLKHARDDRPAGKLHILKDIYDNKATIISEEGESEISLQALNYKWSSVVVVIDDDDAQDEHDFDNKMSVQKQKADNVTGVSVIMPVYDQSSFITRAIASLQAQSFEKWELIVIDDGSKDNLEDTIKHFLVSDKRIKFYKNEKNRGLGYCLNRGFEYAAFDYITDLPADDVYFNNHLETMVNTIASSDVDLVFSGLLHSCNNHEALPDSGVIPNQTLQLVQVLHKKVDYKWMERSEMVTDDLHRMFWHRFNNDNIVGTREVTCEWVEHAMQRHKVLNDRQGGGIYLYKKVYGVAEPIRFQTKVGNYIDEISHFENFRSAASFDVENGLKILLVGELAFNPERICALEERGHKLYGLWMENPVNFNTRGPLPFGNVEDVPLANWQQRVKEIKPDIIYALLNYQTVPLAHHVLTNNPGIPFVWHFKEGPFYCRSFKTWPMLIDLYAKSDGQIYNNELVRDWFLQLLPEGERLYFVLDGDLPKIDWFTDNKSALLSDSDGEIHTVVAGRPMGILPEDIKEMADQHIHLHIYGNIFQDQFKEMIAQAKELAPNHLHLHPNCPQEEWVSEFSQYDAGWLHFFKSSNYKDLMRVSWHDLNFPARMSTYAIAGLPMLLRNNSGHSVASQDFLDKEGMALLFDSVSDLGQILGDKNRMQDICNRVWSRRDIFSFDYYVDDLILFFRSVIENYEKKMVTSKNDGCNVDLLL